MNGMTISRAARKVGVGVETIRFYERRGLIEQPPRPATRGFRTYPAATIQRVRFIRQAQDLGFSLKDIDALLSLRADPSTDCAEVREQAQAKLEEVERKIVRLTAIQLALRNLIGACPGKGAAARNCSIFDALESHANEGALAGLSKETTP